MDIVSPCIDLCKLDENNICIGCHRSIDEIADWSRMTDLQRGEIMERIAKHKQNDYTGK